MKYRGENDDDGLDVSQSQLWRYCIAYHQPQSTRPGWLAGRQYLLTEHAQPHTDRETESSPTLQNKAQLPARLFGTMRVSGGSD